MPGDRAVGPSSATIAAGSPTAKDFYTSDEYARRTPGWHREHSQWKAAQVLAMLRRNAVSPRSVVEVGCGAGAILAELQRNMPTETGFVGYDIAPAAIDLTRPLENSKLRFVRGDFLSTLMPPADPLLALDAVEHIDDHRDFLRALCPGACPHIIQLPLDLSLLSNLQRERLRWARESVGHLHFFAKNTALRLLRETGYAVADWFFTAVELDLPPPESQQQRLREWRRIGRRLWPGVMERVLGGFSIIMLCEPIRR